MPKEKEREKVTHFIDWWSGVEWMNNEFMDYS